MNAAFFGTAVFWLNEDYCLRLTQALAHFLWQGCAIAAGFAAVDWLLRKHSANARYVCGLTALLLMAACLPATLFLLPARSGGTSAAVVNRPLDNTRQSVDLSAAASAIAAKRSATDSNTALDRIQPTSAAIDQIPARRPMGFVNAWMAWLSPYATGIYFIGLAVMLGRLCLGLWGGRRLRWAAIPEIDPIIMQILAEQAHRLQLRITPPLAWSARITVPIVVGVLRPMILLPATLATGLSADQLQAVLLHELAHVRRYDLVANVLQRTIEALLFFHPAVWWLSRRVSLERENACDDLVLRADCPPLKYADALLRVAELCAALGGQPATDYRLSKQAVMAATGDNPSHFKRRVLRLLGKENHLHIQPSPDLLVLCTLALVTYLIVPGIVHT
jgi:beta-lactamase regulating signal transducer with metallopeptidase domain